MAEINPVEVKGFEQLNRQLKKLDDNVKRSEILKIQKRLAKPIEKAYSAELPKGTRDKKRFGSTYPKGTLKKSVATRSVPKSKTGGNPAIVIRPVKKASADPYYKFMIVKKGTQTGSISRGSRIGENVVVDEARDRAIAKTGPQALAQARDKTADYIQKQINRLSTK